MIINCDVLIVGTGISGVFTALNLNKDLKVLLISKEEMKECNSYLAQGGISTALSTEDIPSFIEDTLKAGNYKNSLDAVKILAEESMNCIKKLIELGVPFDKTYHDEIRYTREGGHSTNRIAHVKDETGKYIMKALYNELKKRSNIEVLEHCRLIDIIKFNNKCLGGICNYSDEQIQIHAKSTVLATGGIGGLFTSTTNHPSLTGDGISICLKHDIPLKDISYLQLHPTVLYEKNVYGKRLLLSEALRGEGGIIRNLYLEEFVDPLKPRDVVSSAILKEIEKTPNRPYVYLDLTHLSKDFLMDRFPFLYNECFTRGYDMSKDLLPIAPAHHYAMGGIEINSYCETPMKNLYAVGETACTGVHGNNRLASNSLMEGVVFSSRLALKINERLCYPHPFSSPKEEDLINFLKERVDENYVKLFNC
ncbi:MAG: L-aspartate oxidase [Clostridium sp.]